MFENKVPIDLEILADGVCVGWANYSTLKYELDWARQHYPSSTITFREHPFDQNNRVIVVFVNGGHYCECLMVELERQLENARNYYPNAEITWGYV